MASVNFNNAMLRSARAYAGWMTAMSKANSESSRVRATIRSDVKTRGKHTYIIRTRAGGPNARDARAREEGSGIHGAFKRKYPIRPKKSGGVLVFAWDKASDAIPKTPDGRVILKEVMHPGIRADNGGIGYIGPAQEKARKRMRKKLLKDGVKGIRLDIKPAWIGATVK